MIHRKLKISQDVRADRWQECSCKVEGGEWRPLSSGHQWRSGKKKKVYVLGTFDHGELVSALDFQNQKW